MLTELCAELRNYFCKPENIHSGTFSITSDGNIEPCPFLQEGQYFRIRGSVFNDGVHCFGDGDLTSEQAFPGEVWAMAVPPAVIALDAEIEAWINDNQAVLNSPYQSESFGGYTYMKAGAGYNAQGNATTLTWQDHFSRRLSPWKKVCVL